MEKMFGMVLLLFVLISGCATSGRNIEMHQINRIVDGITTEAEILAMFGEPTSVSLGSEGIKRLEYGHTKVRSNALSFVPVVGIFAGTTTFKTKVLKVSIDAKTEIVETHEYLESGESVTGF